MGKLDDWTGIETTSDKKSLHRYDRTYKFFISHLIGQAPKMLEIGVQGGDSIDLWQKYFLDPHIVGCDIAKKPDGFNFEYHFLDQSDRDQLSTFAQSQGTTFDFIIDDGSHCTTHQLQTILELWVCLKPGGIYIIEDVETSYWGDSDIYGYRFNANLHSQNVIRCSVDVISEINSEFCKSRKKSVLNPIAHDIELVSFGHNCVVFIKKEPSRYHESYRHKQYRFSDRQNQHDFLSRVIRKARKTINRIE